MPRTTAYDVRSVKQVVAHGLRHACPSLNCSDASLIHMHRLLAGQFVDRKSLGEAAREGDGLPSDEGSVCPGEIVAVHFRRGREGNGEALHHRLLRTVTCSSNTLSPGRRLWRTITRGVRKRTMLR